MRNKKEKIVLLMVIIGAGVIALAAGTGVYLLQKKASELEADNGLLHTRVAQAQTKLAKLPVMRAQRESAQGRLEVAERIMPSLEEIENLVDNLSEFAEKSGIVIAKAAPVLQGVYARGGVVKRFEEANFDLDLVGDYFQFVEFLNLLENYKRFIRVDSFALKAGRSEEEPLDIDLKFGTFTYVGGSAGGGK